MRRKNFFKINDVFEFIKEQHVDFCMIMDQAQIHIAADQLRDREESVVMPVADVADQLFCRTAVEFRKMQMIGTDF